MSDQTLRVLHVEDDFADAMLVQHAVCEAGDFGIEIEVAGTLKDAKRKLIRETFDLIMLDLRLPDSTSPADTYETTKSMCGDTPMMVLSGSVRNDRDQIPDDVVSLDKNASFKGKNGKLPVELASIIRETAEDSDFLAL